MRKRIAILFVMILMVALIGSRAAAGAESEGAVFTAADCYRTSDALPAFPHTWEVWVKVDTNASSSRLGVLIGNYGASTAAVNLEIREKGNPYIYWCNEKGKTTIANFSNVDLRTGRWLHLAVTADSGTARCYIDGELKQTLSLSFEPQQDQNMGALCLGGDFRSGNVQYLKSAVLGSVAIFQDVRTAEEIQSDMDDPDYESDGILGAWDLSQSGKERLKDLSNRGHALDYLNSADPSKNEYSTPVEDDPEGGMAFRQETLYTVSGVLADTPLTYEATVWFPKTLDPSLRGGIILGNYPRIPPYINFEVTSNGAPRLYWVDTESKTHNYVFNKVNLYSGVRTHVAITVDEETDEVRCYTNGVLRQTLALEPYSSVSMKANLALGGDYRSDNVCAFRGRIFDVALYADVRTEDEIRSDCNDPGADDLLLRYDLRDVDDPEAEPDQVRDLSPYGLHAVCTHPVTWMQTHELQEDYAYSFVFLGDTQIMNEQYPEGFVGIYDWILENADQKKIRYVLGLGDITNRDLNEEWERARTQFNRLSEAGLEYSLVRGNHDTSSNFNRTFNNRDYTWLFEGQYDNKIENTWRIVEAGKNKYLIFTLDYGPSDEMMEWAGSVIDDHPDCQVIITTHCYLFRDGTTLDQNDVCPPATTGGHNNGDDMWDKFISQYDQIVLVVNGHDPSDEVVLAQTKGIYGNTVSQLLIDPQGTDASLKGTGMVTILYFSEDGRHVQVETYSTVKGQYYLDRNQFSFVLDTNGKYPDPVDETETQPGSEEETERPSETDKEPEVPQDETEPPKNGGCGALTVSVPICFALSVTGAWIVLWKRKREATDR
ncbi:MAG: metallophosphoesterase [Clostridia bacterium]|nr:metallophosphoesterase [Clostridia bacterium]